MSETELAARAATTVERVRHLTELGILQPRPDGMYRQVDVSRIRVVEALDGSGIPLENLAKALAGGHVSLEFVDNLFFDPVSYIPGKSLGEVAREHGIPWELVEASHVRLGLARPSADSPVREDELRQFPAAQLFMGAGLEEGALIRFSRVVGENIRRLADAQVHFFKQTVIEPMVAAGMSPQQAWDTSSRLSPDLTPMFEWLLLWLYRRQQENYLLQDVVERLEAAMEEAGLGRARVASPPAIAFLDLSGFTRLTEEQGDQAAATLAGNLAELVQESAHAHAGKPVKLLGDGVMFYFPSPGDAVRCSLDLVSQAPASGLPPAHVGVDAGPVVFQEGDYFGRTVNVAARIAAKAAPGEVLVSGAVVDAVREREDGLAFKEVGPAELKGVARPVVLHRVLGPDPAASHPGSAAV